MTMFAVYWQPGCTSCLKTKEFLRSHGIPFESVNVREDAGAMERLARLGAKSIPVVTRGDEFVLGQDLDAVAHFVGVAVTRTKLPNPVLVARLIALLDLAATYAERLPAGALQTKLPGRERTYLDLAYHVPQIVVGFLDAALGGRLTFEHFERRPPEHVVTGADAARITRSVSQALAVWWSVNQGRLPDTLDTYYGVQPLARRARAHDLARGAARSATRACAAAARRGAARAAAGDPARRPAAAAGRLGRRGALAMKPRARPLVALLAAFAAQAVTAQTLLEVHAAGHTLDFVDPGSGRKLASVEVAAGPRRVAVAPDGKLAAVLSCARHVRVGAAPVDRDRASSISSTRRCCAASRSHGPRARTRSPGPSRNASPLRTDPPRRWMRSILSREVSSAPGRIPKTRSSPVPTTAIRRST